MRWAEITIEAETNAQEAVSQALEAAGCNGVALQSGSVTGYLPTDDRLEGRLDGLQTALAQMPSFGFADITTDLTLRYVEEADWANAWKAFYKPIHLGRHLVVTPPWETPELGPSDIPIVLDPGMAFGTGSHPTTQLCLTALEDYVQKGQSVADVGTGSGILAIAAAKLGASPIIANDIDPLAVKIAIENADINGVSIEFGEAFPLGQYQLVVANILADVIIGFAEAFQAIVKPGGILIVSGIIDTRESDVRFAVEACDFAPLETRRQAEWVALIFRRNAA